MAKGNLVKITGIFSITAVLSLVGYLVFGNKNRIPEGFEFVKLDLGELGTLNVLRSEVTRDQWDLCVADGRCKPQLSSREPNSDHPITNVNYFDASDFADWLKWKSGIDALLPTKAEWLAFAGDHKPEKKKKLFRDPNLAWAADYDINAEPVSKVVMPIGSFGSNKFGLKDLKGNVWEWTRSCEVDGKEKVEGCSGYQVAMGTHTAKLSPIISDAGNSGCGGGIPPANLGFRVVYR